MNDAGDTAADSVEAELDARGGVSDGVKGDDETKCKPVLREPPGKSSYRASESL